MNSFYEYFKSRVLSPRLEEVFQKFLVMRKKCKYSIFVEGILDKKFYQNYLFYKLKCKFKGDINLLICNGKDGVIEISDYLFDHSYLTCKTNDIISIVDRDFDELKKYQCKIKNKISLTKYYSLESYAFLEQNIHIILNYLDFTLEEKKLFIDNLNKFTNDILDYQSLLYLSVNNEVNFASSTLLTNSELFFDDNIIIDANFENKVHSIISSLPNKYHIEFKSIRNKLSSNFLLFRGHDLELYFNYMMLLFNKDYKFEELICKEDIINKLFIDFNIC